MSSGLLKMLRDWRGRSLANAFTLPAVLIAIASSMLVAAISLAVIYRADQTALQSQLQTKSDRLAERVRDAIEIVESATFDIAKNPLFISALLDSRGRETYVAPYLENYKFPITTVTGMGLCDANGEQLAAMSSAISQCSAESVGFKTALDSGKTHRELITLPSGVLAWVVYHPVMHPYTGLAEGLVVAKIDLNDLLRPLPRDLDLEQASMQRMDSSAILARADANGSDETSFKTASTPLYEVSSVALPFEISVVAADSYTYFDGKLVQLFVGYLLGSALLVLCIVYLMRNISARLIEPLTELTGISRSIAESGNLNIEIPQKQGGEVGELAGAFGVMVQSLRNSEAELERKVELRTRELRASEAVAAAASQAKSQFLANMSHEIRTPLNAIIGLAHLLADDDLNEAQHQLVSKIQFSGRTLLDIVNDVLDLSKIEAREMSVDQAPFQLREMLEELGAVFATQAEAKGLTLHVDLDNQLPQWVTSDVMRLRQILSNLLSNALKFTAQGDIGLSAQVIADRVDPVTQAVHVRFTVKDSGIGIAAETVPKLFKPFAQADVSTSRSFGGTGLGLSLVREFVQLLGGEEGLESEQGVGSRFWVELPLHVPSSQDVSDLEKHESALFLLIAEDNPSDSKQLERNARALGWRTQVVTDGLDLVQTFTARHAHGLPVPDALIVDWQMPQMDGLHALATLVEQFGRDALPAVLMVSAFERSEVAASDKAHLVDRILQKPVGSSELFNAVNDVVTHHTGNFSRVLQATRTEAVKAHWLPGVRVLVVDDSPLNLEVVEKILQRNGAVVTTVDNGKDALTQLQLPSNDFDAVLMDVQMPQMDGLETTRRVRELPGLASLPIIALTAGALVEERRRALESGMNDFLTKPVDPSQLINRLRSAVERYRAKSVRVEPIGNAGPVHDGEWPHVRGLNSDTAKRLLLGDVELFFYTLTRLLDEHAPLENPVGAEIDQAEAAAMRLEIAARVHKLRSSSGTVGAEQLHQLAGQVENALRSPEQPAQDLLVKLAASLRELREHSAPVIQDWRQMKAHKHASMPPIEATPITAHDWEQLMDQISLNDLKVLDWVNAREALLQEDLGSDVFQQLQSSLANLEFEQAHALLTAWFEKNGTGS